MNRPATPAAVTSPLFRRFVLGTAFFLGLAFALAPRAPSVHAQEPKSPAATAPATPKSAPKSPSAEIKIDLGDPDKAGKSEPSTAASPDTATVPPEGSSGQRNGKPRKQARVTIDGLGTDTEFDSFDEFVNNEPALFAMVVAVVAVVFFAPVLAIALILGYRMRKARMLNETMLKFAEKGIVPPAEAMGTLSGGTRPAALAPYYEQARQVRQRAAWSDLRKGVLMAGLGIALSMYSLLSDQEPNGLGLVLLFVGLGFIALWWFEQRHLVPAEPAPREAISGPSSGAPPPA